MSKATAILSALLSLALLVANSAVAADTDGLVLPSGYVKTKGAYTCGYVNKKWQPGSFKKGEFYLFASQLSLLKSQAKKASGAKKASLQQKIAALQEKISKWQKAYCKTLKAPVAPTVTPAPSNTSISEPAFTSTPTLAPVATPTSTPQATPTSTVAPSTGIGLSELPDAADLTVANSALGMESVSVVQGTPPALGAIPTIGPKTLFWSSGVIEGINGGSPTHQQCSEFFVGQNDGESGGLSACHMAQGVGMAFQPIIQGSSGICYLKKAPSKAALDAGAITVVKGALPGDDITKLFSVPAGSTDRVVKVATNGGSSGGQNIFVRISSQGSNTDQGNKFAADMWFCRPSDGTVVGFEKIELADSNTYSDEIAQVLQDFHATIAGSLKEGDNGALVFDTSKDRQLLINVVPTPGSTSKASIIIGADNLLKTRSYDVTGAQSRKGYCVSNFSGTGIDDLRFLEGAFKEENFHLTTLAHQSNGASEYRNSLYTSAPTNALLSNLSDANFDTEAFYSSAPTVNIDTSAYSCSTEADIIVSMDMSNSALAQAVSDCARHHINGMNFCSGNSEIAQAQNNWFSYCSH